MGLTIIIATVIGSAAGAVHVRSQLRPDSTGPAGGPVHYFIIALL